jgi:hypothetical protein
MDWMSLMLRYTVYFHVADSYFQPICKQEVLGRSNRPLSFDTRTAEKTTRPTIILLLRVYSLPRGRFLQSRCLATMGGYKYRHTD